MRDSMDYADKFAEAYLCEFVEWDRLDDYWAACPPGQVSTKGEAGFRERVRSLMADTLS